jgi:glycosyltransferase involved in cell wall biosynthesis
LEFRSLYAAFDLYPSAKGAATHIHQMSKALFTYCGNGYLYVLGNERLPTYQKEGNIEIFRFNHSIENYLQRAESYGISLANFISVRKNLKLIHFRDIWSGLAILGPGKPYKTIFEINALMSIELPYRYQNISKPVIEKIRGIELYCIDLCDSIICPSESIKQNLIKIGVNEGKINVITNGADTNAYLSQIENLPSQYILYFGALQYWQGVDDLIKAFAGLKDYPDLKLVICSSNRPVFSKPYKKLAEKLRLANSIIWNFQLPKDELNTWIKNSRLTVAPMKETERNLNQGFSPLKIFESMAQGTPVLATDLPSVREIITDKKNGRLVRPDRPAELSRAIRFLLDYPDYAKEIGENGYKTVVEKYNWQQKISELTELYSNLIKFENQ